MRKVIDLTGQRFGRLTVIERVATNNSGHATWLCQCDCGNTVVVESQSLRNGDTKSCGCISKGRKAHEGSNPNMSDTKLYEVWKSMRQRCSNKNRADYASYGGRGIKVCDEWLHNFQAFYEWGNGKWIPRRSEY